MKNSIIKSLIRKKYISKPISYIFKPILAFSIYLENKIVHIPITGGKVVYDDILLFFPDNFDTNYATKIFWKGNQGYEPFNWLVLKYFIEKSDIFFDIGSQIGLFSVLAKKVNRNIIVYSFEPVSFIYDKNCEFQRVNNTNVNHILKTAISNKDGRDEIIIPTNQNNLTTESRSTLEKISPQASKSHRIESIETITLNTFCNKFSIKSKKILIKIDVEDHEASVIEGSIEFINNNRPIIVCEILYREHLNVKLIDLIESLDYEIYNITAIGLIKVNKYDFHTKRKYRDYLLLHESQISFEGNIIEFSKFNDLIKY